VTSLRPITSKERPDCPGRIRDKLKLVFTGHVDHGKSTVIGRLLFDTGSLPQGVIDRVRAISAESGQPFEFAYLLDAFEEERKQGITIDTTQLQFRTERRDYVIIDAPGHKEFLKNMISGASDAEAAFLVVDAQRGVEEQSRRHAHVLSLLGISEVSLIVNKMDLVGYSEEAFLKVKGDFVSYLAFLGLAPTYSLPLSALHGENVLGPSRLMPWYQGPSLIGALDAIERGEEGQGGLRLPIQDVYKFDRRRILAGRLESGRLSPGDEILISPGSKTSRVASLEYWLDKDRKAFAQAGQSVGITLEDEFYNRRGEVISRPGDPPQVTAAFKASIFWMGKSPLRRGRRYKLRLASQECEASVSRIVSIVESSDLSLKAGASEVGFCQVAEVEIETRRPLALDTFKRHKATGRFVLVDGYDVSGGGIVTEIGIREAKGFFKGELAARCELFEEYWYSLEAFSIDKGSLDVSSPSFSVGDSVPIKGLSYEYPESFDILVLRDRAAVKIREGKFHDLIPFSQYSYEGQPLVNGRGFAINAQSQEEVEAALSELMSGLPASQAEAAVRWLDFNAYRRIAFRSEAL
jgi:sulfate adenylyltransferase large subunit